MNRINLIGRLTRDPELRYTQSATPLAVVQFTVAVNRRKKGECDFINCNAFGKTAETIEKYFKKGAQIGIDGSLRIDTAEKDGEKRTYAKVVVDNITFCGSKSDNAAGSSTTQQGNAEPPAPWDDSYEDDLPF